MTRRLITALFTLLLFHAPLLAQQTYSIYLDADFDTAEASSISIFQGIHTALSEIKHEVQGYKLQIVVKNHSASPLTSRDNLKRYLQDNSALVVFSGLHSPPVISNKSFINQNKILLLDPWAAAASITRSDSPENWIFRLSIDDKSAGQFIADSVLKNGYHRPYLMLEDTVWGHSNYDNMSAVFKNRAVKPAGVTWFDWNIELTKAVNEVIKVDNSNADSVIFVGNAAEAKVFAQAVISTKRKFSLPIYSHWGITGGDFYEYISQAKDHGLHLTFIQTKFAFTNNNLTPFAQQVLANAIKFNDTINQRQDIKAPAGFIHAYDMTQLLIAAIKQAGLTGNKAQDRQAIHYALEHLEGEVQGLIKTYKKPFGVYSMDNLDAHEALDKNDYTFGAYNEHGEIILHPPML